MSRCNFYFQLHPGSICKEQVVGFLGALIRYVPGDLLIVWDRLGAHRSALVRDFVAEQNGRIHIEYLPAYAPELNPVEYLWGHWKQHTVPNFCPRDFQHLRTSAASALKKLRRRKSLIAAFWIQASLF